MHFEYDSNKSAINLAKHGIDFEEAQSLWDDVDLMRFEVDVSGEERWGVLARYAGSVWVAICTTRGDATRIISVRRATKKEVSRYDKNRYERF